MTTATKELTKKEQLKVAFSRLTKEIVTRVSGQELTKNDDRIVDNYINLLLKEVSIRTDLR